MQQIFQGDSLQGSQEEGWNSRELLAILQMPYPMETESTFWTASIRASMFRK